MKRDESQGSDVKIMIGPKMPNITINKKLLQAAEL